MKRIATLFLSIGAVLLVACEDGAGPGSSVAIKFRVASPGAGAAASALQAPAACMTTQGTDDFAIACDNGTLTITDIRVIVEEFELEPVEVEDCDVVPEPASCADFEARFLFIPVPVNGDPVTVATSEVPVGMYDQFEFEVDDLEIDDDDPEDVADAELIEALFDQIRTVEGFPDWPEKASMVVVGTFTPAGDPPADPIPFETYFEAEIEVEFEFVDPFEVTEAGSPDIEIVLSPNIWFERADGTVLDLSQFDISTGALIEFELEIEDGFELEIDN